MQRLFSKKFSRKWLAAAAVLALLLSFCPQAYAGSKEDKGTINSNISAPELDAIHDVLDRMAEAFKKGDAEGCFRLFAPRAQRPRTLQNLQREFSQVRHTGLEDLSLVPGETIPTRGQSGDFTNPRRIEKIGAPSDQPTDSTDNTIDTFFLQRQEDGTFLLLESPFFEKIGQRRKIGLLVDALLGLMAIVALLVFWVWMGFDAYRARPRALLWRILVIFPPLLGAALYFLVRYLPAKLKRQPGPGLQTSTSSGS